MCRARVDRVCVVRGCGMCEPFDCERRETHLASHLALSTIVHVTRAAAVPPARWWGWSALSRPCLGPISAVSWPYLSQGLSEDPGPHAVFFSCVQRAGKGVGLSRVTVVVIVVAD